MASCMLAYPCRSQQRQQAVKNEAGLAAPFIGTSRLESTSHCSLYAAGVASQRSQVAHCQQSARASAICDEQGGTFTVGHVGRYWILEYFRNCSCGVLDLSLSPSVSAERQAQLWNIYLLKAKTNDLRLLRPCISSKTHLVDVNSSLGPLSDTNSNAGGCRFYAVAGAYSIWASRTGSSACYRSNAHNFVFR